jgi:hypothetical protein
MLPARLPLVGRAGELAEMLSALDGAVVLVGGEPGSGKSRLAGEVVSAATARGVAVLLGRADPDEGSPPLWPWLEALAGLPERALLADLTRAASPSHDAHSARTLAFDAVLAGLPDPALVVLEDLHWADASSLRLLRMTAGRPGIGILATYRTTEQTDGLRATLTDLRRHSSCRPVELGPWAAAEVALCVAAAGAHPSWTGPLTRLAAGNPLTVDALLRALDGAGRAREPAPAGGGWPWGVPDRIVDVTADRLSRLAPATRLAVEVTSLAGVGTGVEHLLLLAEREPARPVDAAAAVAAFEDGVAAGLLTRAHAEPADYDVAHALLRDAVYARMPARRRIEWHTRLADAIDAGELAGEPVTHRLRAAVDPPSRAAAVAACRAAAAESVAAIAFDRAVELLDAALALPGGDRRTRTDMELDAADAEFGAGLVEAAVRRCERTAATADPDQLVRAALVVRGIQGPHNATLVTLCDTALGALAADDEDADLGARARVLAQRALASAETVGWRDIERHGGARPPDVRGRAAVDAGPRRRHGRRRRRAPFRLIIADGAHPPPVAEPLHGR